MADVALLFRQAPMTAHDYMVQGIKDIDELLGEDYAEAHPELLAAYMTTCALDFMGMGLITRLEGVAEQLSLSLLQREETDAFGEQSDPIETTTTEETAARPQHRGLFSSILPQWETVEALDSDSDSHSLERLRIEGGYLYRTIVKEVGVAMVFVPDGKKMEE